MSVARGALCRTDGLRRAGLALSLLLLPIGPAGLAARAQADAPQVAVAVDPSAGEVGLVMSIVLSITGEASADCALLDLPPIVGGRLQMVQDASTQQSIVAVNGRVTRTLRTEWRLQLIPEQVGTLTIPPFRFQCRGADVASREVSVPVTSSGLGNDAVQMEVRASTDELWAGQIFSLEVTGSLQEQHANQLLPGGLELDLPWLGGVPGLLRLETPPPSEGQIARVRLTEQREALDMRITRDVAAGRLLFSRTVDMLATAPGTIELPPSRFSATLALETRPDRDLFGLLGERLIVTRAMTADAHAPGPVLTVRGPPEEGRPSTYTNAVGRFRFTGTASPTSLRVGDTATITLSLTGEGNLEFVEWPAFDELSADFRLFGKTERKLPRTRVLEIQVSPKNERVVRIPALELAAFDPEQGSYERLTVGPWDLSVSPGGEDGLATLESPAETLSSLETIRETLPEPAGPRWPPWMWVLPGAVVLAGVDLVVRRRAWRSRHPREIARRGARRRLDAVLTSSAEVRDVAQAFGKFLSLRLDGPPAGMTAQEAADKLTDAALADEVRRVMTGWEASYLGGLRLDVDRARAEAARLADRVEAAT